MITKELLLLWSFQERKTQSGKAMFQINIVTLLLLERTELGEKAGHTVKLC